MAEPKKCPVCVGRGNVPYNFYENKDIDLKIINEKCKTCDGTGIVWDFALGYNIYTPIIDSNEKPFNPCDNCLIKGICHCTLGGQGQICW